MIFWFKIRSASAFFAQITSPPVFLSILFASEGVKEFTAIAIAGGPRDAKELGYCPPCGVCRQVLREFSEPFEMRIVVAGKDFEYREFSLEELLPESFGPDFKDI